MKENKLTTTYALRWKQFNHRSYSAFCSLKKEVSIGVLAVATLTFANASDLSTAFETPFQLKSYEYDEIEPDGAHATPGEMLTPALLPTLSRTDAGAARQHRFKQFAEKAKCLHSHLSDVPRVIPIKLLLYGRHAISPHIAPPQIRFYFSLLFQ